MFSQQNSNKISKEELTPILYNLFQKTEEVEVLSNSFYETNITVTLKPDQDSNFKKERKKFIGQCCS